MILISVLIFILGACFGSFINAFLYRYMSKKTILGRSACTACAHELTWYDLVPIVSWVMLSGKCRYCKKNISVQYPVVELLAGLITLLVAQETGLVTMIFGVLNSFTSFQLATFLEFLILDSMFLILLTISVYDAKTKEIPNGFNLTFNVSVILYLLALFLSGGIERQLVALHLVSGLAAFLFFFSLAFFSKETWMGGGDAKLVLGMGLLLGPGNTFIAIFIASWLGAIYGVSVLGFNHFKNKKLNRNPKFETQKSKELPFGPFLTLGCFIAYLYGSQLISLYVKMFLSI